MSLKSHYKQDGRVSELVHGAQSQMRNVDSWWSVTESRCGPQRGAQLDGQRGGLCSQHWGPTWCWSLAVPGTKGYYRGLHARREPKTPVLPVNGALSSPGTWRQVQRMGTWQEARTVSGR